MARARGSHNRKINIPLDVYADLRLIAEIQGTSVADVMRAAFRHYTQQVLGSPKSRGAA